GPPHRAANMGSITRRTMAARRTGEPASNPNASVRAPDPMSWMLARHVSRRSVALIVGEASLIVGAVVLGTWIRLGEDAWLVYAIEDGYLKTAFVAAICLLCLYYADLYNLRRVADRREMFVRL